MAESPFIFCCILLINAIPVALLSTGLFIWGNGALDNSQPRENLYTIKESHEGIRCGFKGGCKPAMIVALQRQTDPLHILHLAVWLNEFRESKNFEVTVKQGFFNQAWVMQCRWVDSQNQYDGVNIPCTHLDLLDHHL